MYAFCGFLLGLAVIFGWVGFHKYTTPETNVTTVYKSDRLFSCPEGGE